MRGKERSDASQIRPSNLLVGEEGYPGAQCAVLPGPIIMLAAVKVGGRGWMWSQCA